MDNCNEEHPSSDDNDSFSSNNSSDNINTITTDINKITITDDELFKDPPLQRDCPICFLPMPYAPGACGVNTSYQLCCGKIICDGCLLVDDTADDSKKGENIVTNKSCCPSCQLPKHNSNEEFLERCNKRMQLNDSLAYYTLGCAQNTGKYGLAKDMNKTLELWNEASQLGCIRAHTSLAIAHHVGQGVNKDTKKAIQHWKIAAMNGHEKARHNLGIMEEHGGNVNRAMKHYIISAKVGFEPSLKEVEQGYNAGHITKEEYKSVLNSYQRSQNEMKSDQREKAYAIANR